MKRGEKSEREREREREREMKREREEIGDKVGFGPWVFGRSGEAMNHLGTYVRVVEHSNS